MNKFITKIKSWSTKKLTLWFAVFVALLYTLADCIITIVNAYSGTAIYFDSTLTTELFSFLKWLVGLGGGLAAVSIVKGDNGNDTEERG